MPAPDLSTRPATAGDADAVLAFWERAAENADRPADSAEAVTRLIARDPDALLLVLDGERIVGSLIVGWDGWRSHLYRLAVDPDRRRLGIGRALLDAAEQRLTAAGARPDRRDGAGVQSAGARALVAGRLHPAGQLGALGQTDRSPVVGRVTRVVLVDEVGDVNAARAALAAHLDVTVQRADALPAGDDIVGLLVGTEVPVGARELARPARRADRGRHRHRL